MNPSVEKCEKWLEKRCGKESLDRGCASAMGA